MKGFPRGNSLCKGAKEECRVFFGGRDEEDEAGARVDVAGSPGRGWEMERRWSFWDR